MIINARATTASLLLLFICSTANAVPVTWFLDGVTFDDATVATGSFTYDATTDTYSGISLTTVAGPNLSGATYTIAADPFSRADRLVALASFPSAVGDTILFLEFSSALTDAGGTVALDAFQNAREATCVSLLSTGNCEGTRDPLRFVTSGQVTTVPAVPVPAAAWLFGSALGLLGWTRRKQR